jgi:hypothetical protein
LHARKAQSGDGRQRTHQQRLANARGAFEQHVPAGHQGDQHQVDDALLTHDGTANGCARCFQRFPQPVEVGNCSVKLRL